GEPFGVALGVPELPPARRAHVVARHHGKPRRRVGGSGDHADGKRDSHGVFFNNRDACVLPGGRSLRRPSFTISSTPETAFGVQIAKKRSVPERPSSWAPPGSAVSPDTAAGP